MLLLDTDVMIDILRDHSPAITWLQALGQTPIGLPGLVAMELIQGCRTRVEQQQIGSGAVRSVARMPYARRATTGEKDYSSVSFALAYGC